MKFNYYYYYYFYCSTKTIINNDKIIQFRSLVAEKDILSQEIETLTSKLLADEQGET